MWYKLDMRLPQIIAVFALIALSGVGGYFFATSRAPKISVAPKTFQETPASNPFFDKQTAFTQGQITSVKDGSITVVKKDKTTSDLPLADEFVVYLPSPTDSNQTKVAHGATSIVLNKAAVINVQIIDSKYRVTSISYQTPLPPPTLQVKFATPSATQPNNAQ
jgi:hypothetical protein